MAKVVRNLAQQEAIAHLSGPMMVLAGPGSGKTSVIVERCAQMIAAGISPGNILVVTFSRMAAGEMKERFLRFIGEESTQVTFGTFHGVFYAILKHAYGYSPANILSEEEKRKLIRQVLIECGQEQMLEGDFLEDILGEISLVKNGRLDLAYYHSMSCPDEVFSQVYASYARALREARKLDFDDMLLECYRLFIRRPDILEAWRGKFAYILVDEFQDINALQYDVVRLLAAPKSNLFIVGDDDQSIYGFRGAKPGIMLGFEKDYPGAKRVLLNVNYRCSGNILETAMEVIKHNQARFPKELSTPNAEGRPVMVRIYHNPQEEASSLAAMCKRRLEAGERLEDTAILFRTNREAEGLTSALLHAQVPFIMREKLPNLYAHWICRDLISYLELARGKETRAHFLQVMNRPARFISREAVAASTKAAPAEGPASLPFVPRAQGVWVDFDGLKAFYREKEWMLMRLTALENDLSVLRSLPPFAAINYIRKGIGYEKFLREYARFRRMKAEDLLSVLEEIQNSARGLSSLESWYEQMERHTRELERMERHQELNREGVTLCTLHASKGLEYDKVIVMNVNEGFIPFKKAVLPDAIEEERRLFYVGMTRAKKELSLCVVRRQGEENLSPSRFLKEAGYEAGEQEGEP